MNKRLPAVTFVLFSYNQEKYIAEAISGALGQDYDNLEIIISDDNSSDGTFEIIERVVKEYKGTAKIVLTKNASNLGVTRHVNKVIEMATGEFIIVAAGDDISIPSRTRILVDAWIRKDKADCSIFTNAIVIDESGIEGELYYNKPIVTGNIKEFIENKRCWVGGFSHGFAKNLYKKFGPICTETFQEDGIIGFRAILKDGITYIDEPTVLYRRHGHNLFDTRTYAKLRSLYQSELGMTKGRLRDLGKAMNLDPVDRKLVKRILRRIYFNKWLFNRFPHLIKLVILLRTLKSGIRRRIHSQI